MARLTALLAALLALSFAPTARAQAADDAGSSDKGLADAGGDAGVPDPGDDAGTCVPTLPTANGTCGIQETTSTSNLGCSTGGSGWTALLGVVAAAGLLRRRRRAAALSALLLLAAAVPARANGEADYPPLTNARPTLQRIAITSSPLTAFVGRRLGASASIWIASHHALELTLFHIDQRTGTDSNNEFRGFGQELGYRYYSGESGPRGFFIGPSLLLGHYTAIPLVGGDAVRYGVPGVALDVGCQAILFDKLVVGVGFGAQYTRPSENFPRQEIPVSAYANAGIRPRVLFALGFSFLSI